MTLTIHSARIDGIESEKEGEQEPELSIHHALGSVALPLFAWGSVLKRRRDEKWTVGTFSEAEEEHSGDVVHRLDLSLSVLP